MPTKFCLQLFRVLTPFFAPVGKIDKRFTMYIRALQFFFAPVPKNGYTAILTYKRFSKQGQKFYQRELLTLETFAYFAYTPKKTSLH